MKTIIHVNQHTIRANRKNNETKPALIVRTYKGSKPASIVNIHGPSVIVYQPDKPLDCGATAWIETQSTVSFS